MDDSYDTALKEERSGIMDHGLGFWEQGTDHDCQVPDGDDCRGCGKRGKLNHEVSKNMMFASWTLGEIEVLPNAFAAFAETYDMLETQRLSHDRMLRGMR